MDTLPTSKNIADFTGRVWHSKAEDLLNALPDESIDLIVTSPPYDDLRAYKGFEWDFYQIAKQSYRVLKKGGVLVWVVGDGTVKHAETLSSFRQALYFVDECGFQMHDTMIFRDPGTAFPDKTRYTQQFEYMFVLSKGRPKTINLQTTPNKWAGDKRRKGSAKRQQEKNGEKSVRERKPIKEMGVHGNVWEIGTGNGKSTKDKIAFQHPAIFPEELARRHILTWSGPNEVVLDYFSGSGTTAKMARCGGRDYIACDISFEYCDLARQRLANTDPLQDTTLANGMVQKSLFAEAVQA